MDVTSYTTRNLENRMLNGTAIERMNEETYLKRVALVTTARRKTGIYM
jgi:hypothetical protein